MGELVDVTEVLAVAYADGDRVEGAFGVGLRISPWAAVVLVDFFVIRRGRLYVHWIDGFGDGHIEFIATIKLIGIQGLILPGALGILPVLTPLAACGMVMFMTGAATTRFRRSEWKPLGPDLLYLSLFAFVAWGRFDLHPF